MSSCAKYFTVDDAYKIQKCYLEGLKTTRDKTSLGVHLVSHENKLYELLNIVGPYCPMSDIDFKKKKFSKDNITI